MNSLFTAVTNCTQQNRFICDERFRRSGTGTEKGANCLPQQPICGVSCCVLCALCFSYAESHTTNCYTNQITIKHTIPFSVGTPSKHSGFCGLALIRRRLISSSSELLSVSTKKNLNFITKQ